MNNRNATIAYEPTDHERAVMQECTSMISADIGRIVGQFMMGCITGGMEQKVACSAFTLLMMSNCSKVILMGSGMDPEDIDMEQIDNIAEETLKDLASKLNAYIVAENVKNDPRRN